MDPEHAQAEVIWNARRVQPVVGLYVAGVFVGFILLAWFVFHSPDAVKALLAAAVGGVASLVPSMLTRVEYRLTDGGLEKRPLNLRQPKDFKPLFAWSELSHVVPTGAGFKFYMRRDEPNPLRRFLKVHVTGEHSGEFHVEPQDRPRVSGLLEERGIPASRRLPG